MAQTKNIINKAVSSETQKAIATIVFSVLFLCAIFYFAFLPSLKQSLSLTNQLKEKKTDLTKVHISSEEYNLLEGQIKDQKGKIVILKEKLFWEKDISKFLNVLTHLAADLPIEFVTLKPEAVVLPDKKDTKNKNEAQFAQVPISVTLRASYGNLVEFLERIETSEKFIKIDTLNIESDQSNIHTHNIKMGLNIFIKEDG
jgi:Tfp pilus assembly protein PilO